MSEQETPARIAALRSTFGTIEAVLDPERLRADIQALSERAQAPDLWDDPDNAQKVTSALSHRQSELDRLVDVQQRLDDIDVLIDMAEEANDSDSQAEVLVEISELEKLLGVMEVQTLLDGEYDALPAIVTIRAGAGGVDAADFAEMVRLLKNAGIQPVVCTMFIGLSDNVAENQALSEEQIRNHPRYKSTIEFNQKMRELSQAEGIPLLDMHSLTPQNPSYLIHPGRNFYRQMTGLIESSLSTS